jgi:hypothetical protein
MTRALRFFDKQPNDIQDYALDFSAWLYAINDTGSSHTVTVEDRTPGALPEDNMTIVASTMGNGLVRALCSGGVHGHVYKLTASMTTAGGRRKESDVMIRVVEV